MNSVLFFSDQESGLLLGKFYMFAVGERWHIASKSELCQLSAHSQDCEAMRRLPYDNVAVACPVTVPYVRYSPESAHW